MGRLSNVLRPFGAGRLLTYRRRGDEAKPRSEDRVCKLWLGGRSVDKCTRLGTLTLILCWSAAVMTKNSPSELRLPFGSLVLRPSNPTRARLSLRPSEPCDCDWN
jgi:hypothetical protein